MKKIVHKWKSGARVSLDPEVVAAELNRLSEGDELTPDKVLDAAKSDDSPLHDYFEWDDSVAAEKFRREQARYLVRSLEVSVISNDEPKVTRAYVSIGNGSSDGPGNQFHHINKVMSDQELRDQTLRKLWNQLLVMKQKYSHFTELSGVWSAIDKAQKKVMSA